MSALYTNKLRATLILRNDDLRLDDSIFILNHLISPIVNELYSLNAERVERYSPVVVGDFKLATKKCH